MEPRGVVRGWYSDRERPPAPYIKLRVYTPSEKSSLEVDASVDTGFSGSLLLAPELYLKLGLNLYEEPEVAEGLIAGGYSVELRVSNGVVELNGLKIPCKVYTTFFASKNLVGREILNRLRLVLDGRSRVVEIFTGDAEYATESKG